MPSVAKTHIYNAWLKILYFSSWEILRIYLSLHKRPFISTEALYNIINSEFKIINI